MGLGKSVKNILIGSSHQFWPVTNAHDSMSSVDVIEMVLWVQPGALYIVDHKLHIRRNPLWLNRAEVNPKDCSTRVLIAHCKTSATSIDDCFAQARTHSL